MDRMLAATAVAEDTHAWFRALRRTARQLLVAAASHQRLHRIVDCGAGTGRNLDWLADFGHVVGIELTPLAIAAGRAKHRRLVRGSVTALPLPSAAFDLATSFDVLYCLDDEAERQAIAEMWRVLKPGGLVLVNAAALDILRGSHSTLTHEVRRYTKTRLTERLTRAGFVIQRATYTNMTLFPPTLAIRGLQRWSGKADEASEADLAVPSAPVNSILNLCLATEAAALRFTNLPIGTSVMAVARKPRA